MKHEFICEMPYPMVKITLNQGESIRIEPGSITYSDMTMEFDTVVDRGPSGGGLGKALARSFLSNQSIFKTVAYTQAPFAEAVLGARQPGEVYRLELGQFQWCLQDGVFLFCETTCDYSLQHVPRTLAETFLSASVSHFMMHTVGHGDMYITSCGKIEAVDITPDRPRRFDNTHVVAWTYNTGLNMVPRIMWDDVATGFMYEFSGFGRVLVQSCCRVKI